MKTYHLLNNRTLHFCHTFVLQAYSSDSTRRGRKLKRAMVDLGMTDLADDLTVEFDFKGYEEK